MNACIKESTALKNRREQIWLSAYLVLPEVGHRKVRNFKQIIIFFYVILWYMYNVFFSKVSHLLCLVKKNPHAEFYIFRGKSVHGCWPSCHCEAKRGPVYFSNCHSAGAQQWSVHRFNILTCIYMYSPIYRNYIFEYFK